MGAAVAVFATLLVLLFAPGRAAGDDHGVLTGTVTDSTGGVLPGVDLTLRSTGGSQHETTTDDAGGYRVEVPPGTYDVVFTAGEFAIAQRSGVVVPPGGTIVCDATLTLSVTAHVAVTAAATEQQGDEAVSQVTVTAGEISARPRMRTGELAEIVPGLVVSQHSGEGKANQFYLRGFNLDHGTDFAATVGGVPVNMPTHAHGQGYLDLNFLIPEIVSGVRFSKGPYFAAEGDFSTAGAMHVDYANVLDRPVLEVSGGGHGWGRVVAAASPQVAGGHLLAAVEFNRNDGPWDRGDDYRRANGVLRYSRGDLRHGWALTGAAHAADWNSTDQVPRRAWRDGRLSRFGAVDLSNGGSTYRHGVSFDVHRSGSGVATKATAYALGYGLDLFSNFTYFLDDPINGDQFEQVDRRLVAGASVSHARHSQWRGRAVVHRIGLQLRNDRIDTIGLHATRRRARHATVRDDDVVQNATGIWADTRLDWTDWLKTTTGVRTDVHWSRVNARRPENGGRDASSRVSPKASVVLGPWWKSEWYVNAGYGFHSNDARGTTITVDPRSGEPVDRVTALAPAKGAEIGFRTSVIPNLEARCAGWMLTQASELVFVGDAGTTEAGRASTRRGVELSLDAALTRWLTIDADLAWSRARSAGADPVGARIPGTVGRVVSFGLTTDRNRLLFGTVRMRHLGPRPLSEDGSIRSRAATLVNAAAGVRLARRVSLIADIFNVLNTSASDVDYLYTSRLPGEPLEGVADVHSHPVVPRTLRIAFSLTY